MISGAEIVGSNLGFSFDRFELESKHIEDRFSISVLLPPGYRKEDRELYPVLYALDAFGHAATTIAVTFRAASNRLRPIRPYILVNVDHANSDFRKSMIMRNRDFLPFDEPVPDVLEQHIHSPQYTAMLGGKVGQDAFMYQARNGRAADFLAFLEEELHPEILNRFHAEPDSASLFGHSYGGMFSLYAATSRRLLFDRICAASPGVLSPESVIYSRYLDLQRNGVPVDWNVDLFMLVGEVEITGDDALYRQVGLGFMRFIDLVKNDPLPQLTLTSAVVAGENHSSVVMEAFRRFLYHIYALE